jgi:hypothetical protein
MNQCIMLLEFLNKGSTVIFLLIFISTTYIITFSTYLRFKILPFRATFASLIRMMQPPPPPVTHD